MPDPIALAFVLILAVFLGWTLLDWWNREN